MTGTILPVLPLRETVVFPESLVPLAIGRERSLRLVDGAAWGKRLLALVAVRAPEVEVPAWPDLYETGTATAIQKVLRVPDGTVRILVRGLRRVRLVDPVADEPYLVGRFEPVRDEPADSRGIEVLADDMQSLFERAVDVVPYLPSELRSVGAEVRDPGVLCDLVASTLRLRTEEKQRLLELADTGERLRVLRRILIRELEAFEIETYALGPAWRENDRGHWLWLAPDHRKEPPR